MSLPPLLKHVYNHGTDEVIRRGKRIYHTAGVQLQDVDHLHDTIRFRVRNDQFYNFYTVTIAHPANPDQLSLRCQCPYNLGDICRHEVAALYQLNDMVQSGFFENSGVKYDQHHTSLRMKQVTEDLVAVYCSPESLLFARDIAASGKATIEQPASDTIDARVPDNDKDFNVRLRQNEERYFHTACECDEEQFPLCRHKAAVFLQVLKQRGNQFFQQLQNVDLIKNKLLEQYGFSLKDDLTGKFEFVQQNGKPMLRVLDTSIKKLIDKQTRPVEVKEPETEVEKNARLGIVLETSSPEYPHVSFKVITGPFDEEANQFSGHITSLELRQYINAMDFIISDRDILPATRKLLPDEVVKYLKKTLPFGDLLEDYTKVLTDNHAPDVHEAIWEYLLPKYQRIALKYAAHPLVFLQKDRKQLNSKNIERVHLSATVARPGIKVSTTDAGNILLCWNWELDGQQVSYADTRSLNEGLVLYGDVVYAVDSIASVLLSAQFTNGSREIKKDKWPAFLEKEVMLWQKEFKIDFSDDLVEDSEIEIPQRRLYLQERDQRLLMQPAFVYDGFEIRWGSTGDLYLPKNGKLRIIHRNMEAEASFLRELRHLHSDIKEITIGRGQFFYLAATAVFRENWFFRFTDWATEANTEVFGWQDLQQLRISKYKPETKIHVSSGIDWFDAQVDIIFGDQHITISDLKKALADKQNFVRLPDGTMGLLPEEWLRKYSLLLKVGDAKGNKLRLKKIHFSVLDSLLEEIDEIQVLKELEEKKETLAKVIGQDFSDLKAPGKLEEQLRPYQRSGYQWLAFLAKAGWGGILADDMGLGKTVQTLAWLMEYKIENPDSRFLVVCPTTLIYNWEAEVKKFTPTLRHFIHHGPKRSNNTKDFDNYDLIITTYGTMRSDIAMLRNFPFAYVVLDESQSIKNPQSQVAKSSLLLQTKHRLCLSGTPVQNNTFDLYAQLNFLNPGMLGSREFFSNEFATPIDKFGEADVKDELRKLTYPFILRRTKEQVAKDLPPKTEMVLYCEMGTEQRKIYDAYRNNYRAELLGLIDERGMQGAQLHVLQGLTRLRQICDSPAILNETEKLPNASIKLEEIIREITENVGNHKALVFSQFLGMLALIRSALKKAGIPFAYFDGSSSTAEREKNIRLFQNDDECRVFLISLKAGGIGLNLTAADYVYIVDPWWNPAVEQQAIDRTHRIGQTKSVMAYRLICKDTIEEKMLLLQERKRELAASLVADDSALLKKLTRDDVAYLLS